MSIGREDPRWEHAVTLRGAIRWIQRHVAVTSGLAPEQHAAAGDAVDGAHIILDGAGLRDHWTPCCFDDLGAGNLRARVEVAGRELCGDLRNVRRGAIVGGMMLALDGIDRLLTQPTEESDATDACDEGSAPG